MLLNASLFTTYRHDFQASDSRVALGKSFNPLLRHKARALINVVSVTIRILLISLYLNVRILSCMHPYIFHLPSHTPETHFLSFRLL